MIIYETKSSFLMGNLRKFNSLKDLYDATTMPIVENIDKIGNNNETLWIPVITKPVPKSTPEVQSYNEYTVLVYKDENGKEIFTTARNGYIRKKKINVSHVTALMCDIDNVHDKNEIKKTWDKLKKLGLSFIMYSTKSYGTWYIPKKSKDGTKVRKWNYRVIIELDNPVSTDDWLYTFEAIQNKIKLDLDKSFKTSVIQHAVAPYAVAKQMEDPNNKPFFKFSDGNPLKTGPFIKEGRLLKEKDDYAKMLKKQERLEKKAQFKENSDVIIPGEMDNSRDVISQINWDLFDPYELLSSANIHITHENDDKINIHCPMDHPNKNDTEAYIIDADPIPVFFCNHETCSLGRGDGATTRFLNYCRSYIPDSWIRGYKRPPEVVLDLPSDITPINIIEPSAPSKSQKREIDNTVVTNITKEKPVLDGMKDEDSPLNFLRSDSKIAAGIFPTGFGKTYSSMISVLDSIDNNEKVIVFLSDKQSMTEWNSDFIQLCNQRNLNYADMKVSLIQQNNNRPSENSKIIVTHYYYLKRRGTTDKLYSVIKWIIENNPVMIADEIDNMYDILMGTIQINARYLKTNNIERKVDKCPSRSSNRFQCDKCEYHNNIYSRIDVANQMTLLHPYKMDAHDKMHPHRMQIDTLDELNNFELESVIYKSLIHELKCDFIKTSGDEPPTPKDSDFIDENFNIHFIKKWMQHIIKFSKHSYIIHASESDRNEIYLDLSKEATFEFNNKRFKFDTPEAREKELKSYISKYIHDKIDEARENKTNNPPDYPYHPCGAKWLKYLDTYALSIILKHVKRVRLMTATMTDNQRALTNDIFGDVQWYNGNNPSFKAIDDLLIVTTPEQFDGNHFYKELGTQSLNLRKEIMCNGTRMTYNKTLYIEKSQKDFEDALALNELKKSEGGIGSGFYMNHGLASDIHGREWGIMRTYSRSSIARGTNLGDFSSAFIDYGSLKPMVHYNYIEDLSLDEALRKEHIMLTKQAVGRIMRKAVDLNKKDIEDKKRRFICVAGCIQELREKDENGKNKKIDLAKDTNNELKDVFNYMLNGEVIQVVLDDTKYWDEVDLGQKILLLQKNWIEKGKIVIGPVRIPDDVYKKRDYNKAKKYYPKISKFQNEEQWISSKFLKKLDKIKKEGVNMSNRELQRKYTWSRLKQTIPSSVLESYTNFFEGE